MSDEAALNDIVDALGDRIFSLEGAVGLDPGWDPREAAGNQLESHLGSTQVP